MTTVRSFSEHSLGPEDKSGCPLGGETFTVFNAEYTFPFVGDLQGAVFLDAGNLLSDARDFGLEDMGCGVGAGMRYNLPIGALHFAIGVAFRCPGERGRDAVPPSSGTQEDTFSFRVVLEKHHRRASNGWRAF